MDVVQYSLLGLVLKQDLWFPAENVILWGFYEFFGQLCGLLLFRGQALKPTASKVREQIVTYQGQIQLEFAHEEAPGERIALICQERIH